MQFSINAQFKCKKNSKLKKTLFSSIWPINRTRARVDLGAMVMKVYSAFPKAPALLEPHHPIV